MSYAPEFYKNVRRTLIFDYAPALHIWGQLQPSCRCQERREY